MRKRRAENGLRRALDRACRDASGFGLVEVLVAAVIGMIGLLAVSGLQLASATQGRIAQWRTGQALAAQQVFERMHTAGYAAAASGTFTPLVDGRTYDVTVTVTRTALRVKRIVAQVGPVGTIGPQTYATRLYQPRPLPAAP
ncbi:MAG: prepilin-type N-terminal cleavage/methylation domain-containing protein [Gemmatimonadota bacterium]|nr:prepilin-type N-terminal cleavage/methylation domain-containing protein [Gemmatimonadota bacterium]